MNTSIKVSLGVIVVLAITVVYLLVGNMQRPAVAVNDNASQTASMKEDFMQPHVPATLTDAQKAELKLGAADHQPTTLTFDVAGGSFYFTPNEITVKQGDKVVINFTNVGGTHNLTFTDFGGIATKTIQGGETDTIEFTADKKGTFEYYCAVGKGFHRMMGQIGVLIVQ